MQKSYKILALMIGLYSQYGLAGPIDLLNEYNLIVFENLKSNSEVEGKTLVMGNLDSGTASNYGTRLYNNAGSEDALVIGGDLTSGTTVNISNNNGVTIGGANSGTVNNESAISTDVSSYDFAQIESDFISFSDYLSQLTANSTLSTPQGSQPGAATFNVAAVDDNVAVFNIDTSDFFGNSLIQQYDINFASQSTEAVIINVAGEIITDEFFSGNAVGNFNNDSYKDLVLWNFYEASDISIGKNLNGSLLAPFADLINGNSIEGSVVVNSFDQNGEIHNPTFNGQIAYENTVAVAEPSSILLFSFGLLGLFAWRRRPIARCN